MAKVAVDKLQVGNVLRIKCGLGTVTARVKSYKDTWDGDGSRTLAFFDHPCTHDFVGWVERTGHVPLNRAEMRELTPEVFAAEDANHKAAARALTLINEGRSPLDPTWKQMRRHYE
jgi:hypothetical protein